jgi:hypothetical protein
MKRLGEHGVHTNTNTLKSQFILGGVLIGMLALIVVDREL